MKSKRVQMTVPSNLEIALGVSGITIKSEYKISKAEARELFDGSNRLFEACWKDYVGYLEGSIDDPEDIEDVMDWLDSIASEKVNDWNSPFYIYGC